MKGLPHHYIVDVHGGRSQATVSCAANKVDIQVAPPTEFGGPGDLWSPEELFLASLANCFILTFRALASAGNFAWLHLDCRAEGILDRAGKHIQFTHCILMAEIVVDPKADQSAVEGLMERAKADCFISNSLNTEVTLETRLRVGGAG